jgi:signal transduction histidine kinase
MKSESQLKAEIERLQRSVDKQALELDSKNRELEVEAALERVRAMTMAMHSSEDVGKCVVKMFSELTSLGVDEGTRFGIGILNHENENNQLWTARKNGEEVNMHIGNIDMASHPLLKSARKAWKEQVPLHKYVLEGEDLLDYYQMLNKAPGYKIQIPIEKLPKREIQHCFIFEHGFFYAFSPSEFQPELIHITRRFSSLFEQTYRRYLDLVKAEAQAREAQIEAVLEKVRSRSLAMHTPNELGEVVTVIVEKLSDLGVVLDANGVALCTYFDDSKDVLHWIVSQDFKMAGSYLLPWFDHPIFREAWESKESGDTYFSKAYSVEDKNSFFEYAFEHSDYRYFPEDFKQWVFQNDKHILSFAWQKNSAILIPSHTGVVPSEEEIVILKRFARVFEQAYVRFLDLQKAEAQAREAQIEAALERVRSRTMAMHRTEELKEVIQVVYDQFAGLNIHVEHAGFILDYKEREDMHIWLADHQQGVPTEISIPYFDSPHWNSYREAKAEQESFFANLLPFEVKNKFYQDLFELIPELTEEAQQAIFSKPALAISTVLLDNVGLYIEHYSMTPYTAEENKILMRFGKVFQQTYTRFLDLQKAEAQAREAKIEAALEKVRSRSLAMHKSEELNEVVKVLFEKMIELQVPSTAVGIQTFTEGSKDMQVFVCGDVGTGLVVNHYLLPYFNHTIIRDYHNTHKEKPDYFVGNYTKKEKDSFYDVVLKLPELKDLPIEVKAMINQSDFYEVTMVPAEKSLLAVNDFKGNPLSESHINILKRFTKVFDQAYTRFLDLQKAEAQAREAQIEAALERVRSRSMAMHKSEELKEVIQLLFEQFRLLNFNIDSAQFDPNYKENDDLNLWAAAPGQPYSILLNIPYVDSPLFNSIKEAKKRGLSFITQQLSSEDKNQFFRHFFQHIKNIPAERQKLIFDSPGMYRAVVFMENVALAIQNYSNTPYTEEENEVLKRFGKTFEQVYTRFLDLQKAEAQAREAQIEAALEKVRSRSLAMHKSGELNEVVSVLFERLKDLQIPFTAVGIATNIEGSKDLNAFVCGQNEAGLVITNYRLPYFDNPVPKDLYSAIEKQLDYFVGHYSKEEKDAFYEYVIEHTDEFRHLPEDIKRMIFDSTNYTISMVAVKNAVFNINDFEGKVLAENEIDIIKRFARVFDQAYIRFLDLQKAEAQARESQIEAALERVRAKTMAMHKSEQLPETAQVLFEQFAMLGKTPDRMSIGVYKEELGVSEWWVTDQQGIQIIHQFTAPLQEPTHAKMFAAWKEGKESEMVELTGDDLKAWVAFVSDVVKIPMDESRMQGRRVQYAAFFTQGLLLISAHEPMLDEAVKLLVRFAKVFSQMYTRFLDLQKAEAQAREAQIELSLERIRSQVTAMQESSDLLDIVVTMRTEFVKLDHEAHYFWHMRWLPERYDKAMTSGDGTKIGMVMTLPRHIHGDIPMVADWEKTKEPTVVLAMEVETAMDYVHKMITLGDFEQVDPQAPTLDDIRHIGGLTFVMARTTHGEIGYSLPGVVTNPPKNAVDTLIRFAGVFDLAYKRFEDLKSAERQHREAQIELALERVRARTMAMQKSEELADAAFVLFEQLRALGGNLWGTGFGLCQEHVEKDEFWFANENGVFPPVAIPNTTDPAHKQMYQGWQKKTDFLSIEKSGAALKSHYDYMLSLPEVRLFFQKIIDEGLSFPEKQQWNAAYFSKGYLLIITLEPYPEPEIFKRFAKVFEQTYTRFLDLQKAEKQAREAEIQLALERVRARSLAMHRSEELADISMELVKQVQTLGMESWFCAFNIYDDDPRGSVEWGSNGQGTFPQYRTPREGVFLRYFEAGQRGETLLVNEIGEEACPAHYEYLCSLPGVGEQLLQMKAAGIPFPTSQIDHVAFFKYGYVLFITYEPAPESHDIFKRFAKVFEQTYTRFLDLQKAEAQAREAQIEAALERVRSRTMAMQNSSELAETSIEMFKQMQALGMRPWACGFNIFEKGEKAVTQWMSAADGGLLTPFATPLTEDPFFIKISEARQRGEELFVMESGGQELEETYKYMFSLPGSQKALGDVMAAGFEMPKFQISHCAFFSQGYLMFITYEPYPEAYDVFKRFAKVFEQTYTRFLDLQKAEAQAREAKVEAALEKVRSRTMGMQSSDELQEVANIMFLEIQTLDIPAWSCGYNILSADKKVATNFMSNEGTIQKPFDLPLTKENSLLEFYQFLKSEESFFTQELDGKALESHYNFMKSLPELTPVFNGLEEAGIALPTYQINHLCKFTHGYLLFITHKPVPDAHDIFKRFTKVFDQTYTRFLDLQKAEKQAREAQIENALEKVRSRSLAMQSPDELIEVAQLLREEMGALGVEELETSSIYIQDESSGLTQCWFTIKNPENPDKAITDQMVIDLQDTWVGRKMDEFYRSKAKQTSILMQGEGRIEWIRYCEEKSDLFGTSNFYGETIPDRTYHLYKFSNGYIGAAAPGEISSESWELLKRATAVFSFAYTRFRDLQMAQASARTAMRQASLDRVRADISSMRNADDLDRITPLIFKELTVLGVPFIRCGVFIIQEKQKIVEAYLSSPEGNSLGVLRLPYKASELTYQTVEAWRKGEVYRQHWNKEDFIQWINQLMKEDQIQDGSTYQGTAAPPESLDLHFVPFAQGMLYVGAVSPLDEKELELVQTLAKAFSIAYARFEDFVKLEQAKAEVESAMSELKATQSQLVQQEKLASLGQLTAGIAHEIKNPLNFVNNFSEVSLELLDEIKETRNKSQETRPKTEEDEIEEEILEDIKANLKKIHEHGSRANGIVTSMLQHSRGGSGKMEPTDLNALIKEYVNLSFHGMRAGKNPINVEIALDLDPDLGMVSLIKEDFTRVVINLCNNAFDAMREKVKKYGRHKTEDTRWGWLFSV